MDHELKGRLEAPLTYGDSRSERGKELIELGLAVEDALADAGIPTSSPEERERIVRDAIREWTED
jgi:hypothetical protein